MDPIEQLKELVGAAGCVLIPTVIVSLYFIGKWFFTVKSVADSLPERHGTDKAIGCYGTTIGTLALIAMLAFLLLVVYFVPTLYDDPWGTNAVTNFGGPRVTFKWPSNNGGTDTEYWDYGGISEDGRFWKRQCNSIGICEEWIPQ